LFDSSKRGAMLCFKNKLCFQNHMIWNYSKKEKRCVFWFEKKQRLLKDFVSKTCINFTP
jgi:hypothetical protein